MAQRLQQLEEENKNLQSGTGHSAKQEAFQRRAAYVRVLAAKNPADLTEAEAKEVLSFVASLAKNADQWSQSGEQYHGPGAANTPATTPQPIPGSAQEGRSEGRADAVSGDHPTYADGSSSGHTSGVSLTTWRE